MTSRKTPAKETTSYHPTHLSPLEPKIPRNRVTRLDPRKLMLLEFAGVWSKKTQEKKHRHGPIQDCSPGGGEGGDKRSSYTLTLQPSP